MVRNRVAQALINRRNLLVSAAVLPALRNSSGQTAKKRSLLADAWTADRIASSLQPRERFRPFPTASDREPWEHLPADAREAFLESGEKQLKTAWEVLPADVFLDFKRNGNRSRYEAIRNRRRNKLQELVIAECLEAKGRFVDEIINGVWLTCEETFWGVPAHLGVQKAGTGLPDVSEPIVDLFAAETSSLLAWTHYLIAESLQRVSPLVPERIRLEIDRRVLTPCLTRDFSWMGFTGGPPNNWNPWISSNWLASTLLMERDEGRRRATVLRILRCLDNFLSGYADDGGCDEGPSYWGRAGGSLFDCLELLHQATGGACDGFSFPLVHQIGLYICRAHIHNEWYTNFADAPARVYTNGDLVYRFGKRLGDSLMMGHGAFAAFLRDQRGLPGDGIGRQLPALFNLANLRTVTRAQALLRDTWLPGVEVMAARCRADPADGLYLAAQGGHNGQSHNHNDVGNFLIYARGSPAIIDVGVETYTATTFSSHRYEIWTMQSAYHNCPTIDGVMQSAGRQYTASDVRYRADEAIAELRLNIAGAYPPEAHLASWNRTLRLNRSKNEIELVDDYALLRQAKLITLTFMTPCLADTAKSGEIILPMQDARPVRILYDSRAFAPAMEEIHLEDPQLRRTWGDRLFRILLRADAPPIKASWNLRFTE